MYFPVATSGMTQAPKKNKCTNLNFVTLCNYSRYLQSLKYYYFLNLVKYDFKDY